MATTITSLANNTVSTYPTDSNIKIYASGNTTLRLFSDEGTLSINGGEELDCNPAIDIVYNASSFPSGFNVQFIPNTDNNYLFGFAPINILAGLKSGDFDTTNNANVYEQGETSVFNSTQNIHAPASLGGELVAKIINLNSVFSIGLVDNYELSTSRGLKVDGDKIYQRNSSDEYEITGV